VLNLLLLYGLSLRWQAYDLVADNVEPDLNRLIYELTDLVRYLLLSDTITVFGPNPSHEEKWNSQSSAMSLDGHVASAILATPPPVRLALGSEMDSNHDEMPNEPSWNRYAIHTRRQEARY
jgi:hypothetical protein